MIKKLQSDVTTPEQSKRLLKLGVPEDSANCYIDEKRGVFFRQDKHDYRLFSGRTFFEYFDGIFFPCWSVGRLIEISELCYTSLSEHDYFIRQKDCNTDFLIKMFELGADSMDFSKLEE